MLKPKQMSRLIIAASRDQMAPVVAELYRHHLFHIEEYVDSGAAGYEGFKIGTPLSGASEKSADLIKIRAISNAVSVNADAAEPAKTCSGPELKAKIERELPLLEREVEELTVRRSKLDTRVKEYEQKILEITPFLNVPADLDLYHGYKRFTVFAGYVAREIVLTIPHEIFISPGKDKKFLVVIVPTEQKGDAERALQEAGFQSVTVPQESGSPQARIDYYTGQISSLNGEIAGINASLEVVRQKHTGFLVACEEFLKAEVDQTEAPLRFATTDQTFVAEGWVPADKADAVMDSLVRVTGGKIYVTALPFDPVHDPVPVEYNNPSFAKPSQTLVDVISRPRYTEVDPTLMIAIVFPLFFGLILGDVGYGLIMLILCLYLRKFIKGVDGEYFLTVLRNASLSSIFFGLLYSEFLGFPIPHLNPIMYSRHLMKEAAEGGGVSTGPMIPQLMIMSIWIGIVHISLGRILGMYNHAKQDHGEHRTKAVLANFGWLAVMWGLLLAIWSVAVLPLMPNLTGLPSVAGLKVGIVVGVVLILAGVIFIIRDSFLEIVEITNVISHVLSYARIMAVGLSSVAIAMVVNFMAIDMFIKPQLANITILGVILIVVGLVIFLVGHAFNTVLGIMSGGIHSVRLHYVEFFTKFYKGGGRKYIPFGMNRRFTEE